VAITALRYWFILASLNYQLIIPAIVNETRLERFSIGALKGLFAVSVHGSYVVMRPLALAAGARPV
jgi:hypothetical protein